MSVPSLFWGNQPAERLNAPTHRSQEIEQRGEVFARDAPVGLDAPQKTQHHATSDARACMIRTQSNFPVPRRTLTLGTGGALPQHDEAGHHSQIRGQGELVDDHRHAGHPENDHANILGSERYETEGRGLFMPYRLSAFRFKSLLSNLHTACKSDGLCPGLRKHRRHTYPLSSSARR